MPKRPKRPSRGGKGRGKPPRTEQSATPPSAPQNEPENVDERDGGPRVPISDRWKENFKRASEWTRIGRFSDQGRATGSVTLAAASGQSRSPHVASMAAAVGILVAAIITHLHHNYGVLRFLAVSIGDSIARDAAAPVADAGPSVHVVLVDPDGVDVAALLRRLDRRDPAAVVVDRGVALDGSVTLNTRLVVPADDPVEASVPAYGPMPRSARFEADGDPAPRPSRSRAADPRLRIDRDGVCRRMPVGSIGGEGMLVPSPPIAAAMEVYGESSLQFDADGRTLLSFASLDLPLDARGHLRLRPRGPTGTFPTSRVTRDRVDVDEGLGEGDIAVVGLAADRVTSVVDDSMPRAEWIATGVDNVVHGDPLREASRLAELLTAAIAAAIVAVLTYLRPRTTTVVAVVVLSWLALSWTAAASYDRGTVLDVAAALVAAVATSACIRLVLGPRVPWPRALSRVLWWRS